MFQKANTITKVVSLVENLPGYPVAFKGNVALNVYATLSKLCLSGDRLYLRCPSVRAFVRPLRFGLLVSLNDLSVGSHFIVGVFYKQCLLTLLVCIEKVLTRDCVVPRVVLIESRR